MNIVYLGRNLWECTAVFLGYILRGRTAGPQNLDIHTASEGCCYYLLFDANNSFWILGSGTKTGGIPWHRVALGNAHTSTSPDRGDSQPLYSSFLTNKPAFWGSVPPTSCPTISCGHGCVCVLTRVPAQVSMCGGQRKTPCVCLCPSLPHSSEMVYPWLARGFS